MKTEEEEPKDIPEEKGVDAHGGRRTGLEEGDQAQSQKGPKGRKGIMG